MMVNGAKLTSLRKRLVRGVNARLAPLEDRLARSLAGPLRHAPVFIVGSPRAGTTLLFQLVTAHTEVAYLSNLHNALWGMPAMIEAALHPLRWRGRPDYRSHLGNTEAWLGVSETPNYWHRFFPERPHCVGLGDVPDTALARLRAAVSLFQRASGRPVVFKTVVNSGRLQPIAAALPEARFLVVRRDPAHTARSLLEARHRTWGTLERWWSFEPPGLETLRGLAAHEQVVEQVLRTYERIDADRAVIGEERFLDVVYESVCEDPRRALARVVRFTGLRRRDDTLPPERFSRRNPGSVPPELREALLAAHQKRNGNGTRTSEAS